MPCPDSKTLGIKIFILDDLYKIEFLFDIIPINLILLYLENLIIFFNSEVFPELLISIKMSFFVIRPKSPCEQSLADIEKDGVPTDERVAEIFDAIIPLFPTPHRITFDLHFNINLTA